MLIVMPILVYIAHENIHCSIMQIWNLVADRLKLQPRELWFTDTLTHVL